MRSVERASWGRNGSAWKLVRILSRPKTAMNQGRPAAGSASPGGSSSRLKAQRGEIHDAAQIDLLEGIPGADEPWRCPDPGDEILALLVLRTRVAARRLAEWILGDEHVDLCAPVAVRGNVRAEAESPLVELCASVRTRQQHVETDAPLASRGDRREMWVSRTNSSR